MYHIIISYTRALTTAGPALASKQAAAVAKSTRPPGANMARPGLNVMDPERRPVRRVNLWASIIPNIMAPYCCNIGLNNASSRYVGMFEVYGATIWDHKFGIY